jgi:Flp pilus assembly pilin Flp
VGGVRRAARGERGASAVEYALILVAFTVLLASTVYAFGPVVAASIDRGRCVLAERASTC